MNDFVENTFLGSMFGVRLHVEGDTTGVTNPADGVPRRFYSVVKTGL